MVENPLAFNFSKTRTICVAFDEAWAFLQGLGSDLTDASKSFASQTILAKRIIEMADQGLTDVPELRDDALAFLQHNPPFRLIAKGSAENHRSHGSLTRRVRGKAVETVGAAWPLSRGGWNAYARAKARRMSLFSPLDFGKVPPPMWDMNPKQSFAAIGITTTAGSTQMTAGMRVEGASFSPSISKKDRPTPTSKRSLKNAPLLLDLETQCAP